jgi:hypothetical protein
MSGMFPFGGDLQKMSEQNAALFDSAMKMFTPFGAAQQTGGAESEEGARPPTGGASGQEASEATLQQLKQQVDLLQKQLDVLTRQQQAGAAGGNGNGSGSTAGPGTTTGESTSRAGSQSS